MVPGREHTIEPVMNDSHTLALLRALIRTYFSDELQLDESPVAAKKRLELRKAILDLSTPTL